MERQADSAQLPVNRISSEKDNKELHNESTEQEIINGLEKDIEGDDSSGEKGFSDDSPENVAEKEERQSTANKKTHRIQTWTEIRPSLRSIEDMMRLRVKKKVNQSKHQQENKREKTVPPFEDAKSPKGASEEDSEDEFYDVERSEPIQDAPSNDSPSTPATATAATDAVSLESSCPWKEELEVLVRGGLPMALRGEVHLCSFFSLFHELKFICWCMSFTIDFLLSILALASICGCKGTPC